MSGISRCGYHWLARYRSGFPAFPADRRSVPRTHRRNHDQQQLQHAWDIPQQRQHLGHIVSDRQTPFSTVASAPSLTGLGRHRDLELNPPFQRYD
jgi:hypothetical protein